MIVKFFWISRDKLQSTLQGLYRSLLFEFLSCCPELIEKVFHRQWARIQTGYADRVVERMEFGDGEVEEFGLLVKQTTQLNHLFCFFINGLDKYHGILFDLEKLALQLNGWAQGSSI